MTKYGNDDITIVDGKENGDNLECVTCKQIMITMLLFHLCSRTWESVLKCTLGVFPALAFVADFLPAAPEFHQCTHRVHLWNLGTTDKKSAHKIKHKKIPRVH